MINDFNLIVLWIVCASGRLGVVESNAITQKGRHSDNVLWLNLYLYPKWFDKNYFDQVTKLLLYLLHKPFFERWRLRLCFRSLSCRAWLSSSSSSRSSSRRCSS